jgi:hypothetical protein
MTVGVGVQLWPQHTTFEALAEVWREAEDRETRRRSYTDYSRDFRRHYDDEYGEPVQCLRHSHRTTIRIAGAAAEGSHSEEELLAKAREYLEARDWVAIPQKTWDRSSPALGLAKTAVGNGELYPQEHGLVFDGQTPCVRDD